MNLIFASSRQCIQISNCFDQQNLDINSSYEFTDTKRIFEICDVIIFCIKTNKEIFDILKKYKIKNNTIFVDLTTSLPDITIQINSYLEKFNSFYIDAGMSGGASGAFNANLNNFST